MSHISYDMSFFSDTQNNNNHTDVEVCLVRPMD